MTTEDTNAKNIALWVTALIFRDKDGKASLEDASKPASGEIQFSDALKIRAATLLGKIDSYSTGQGAFNLLIPKTAIVGSGFHEKTWEDAQDAGLLKTIQHGNPPKECYEVDYMTATTELLPRLEMVAGKKWSEARAQKDATRGDIEIT